MKLCRPPIIVVRAQGAAVHTVPAPSYQTGILVTRACVTAWFENITTAAALLMVGCYYTAAAARIGTTARERNHGGLSDFGRGYFAAATY